MSCRAKRRRVSPEHAADSDAEGDAPSLPGAAERKRELERNRRNLVNVRFAELESQLARLPGAPARVYRRIDKEVVLKDAAVALATQQRELEHANSRLESMADEIQSLRAEKLELRRDKTYLHNELATAKADVISLSNDNRTLWLALRSAGALKQALESDYSKIPIDVVFGKQGTEPPLSDFTGKQPHSDSSRSAAIIDPSTAVFARDPLNLVQDQSATADPLSSANLGAIFSTDSADFVKDSVGGIMPRTINNAVMLQFGLGESRENSLVIGNQVGLDDVDHSSPDVAPCG